MCIVVPATPTYLNFTGANVLSVHLMQGAHHTLDVVELYEGKHLVGLLILDVDILRANNKKTPPFSNPAADFKEPVCI